MKKQIRAAEEKHLLCGEELRMMTERAQSCSDLLQKSEKRARSELSEQNARYQRELEECRSVLESTQAQQRRAHEEVLQCGSERRWGDGDDSSCIDVWSLEAFELHSSGLG